MDSLSSIVSLLALVAASWFGVTSAVCAQEPSAPTPAAATTTAPTAAATRLALLRTASLDPALKPMAEALDAKLTDELGRVQSVDVALQPSLDLPAMQLALDCVGETLVCMQAVADEAGVESLLAPILRSSPTEVLLTLLHYDGRARTARGAERRIVAPAAPEALLALVPDMLKELFDKPAPALVEATPPAPVPAPAPAAPSEAKSGRVLAIALAATGAVLLGVGTGLGVSARRAEQDYAKAQVGTEEQIDDALSGLERAENRATAAHVMFGTGGAVLLAGAAVWLFTRRSKTAAEPTVTLLPGLAPGALTLSLGGRFSP